MTWRKRPAVAMRRSIAFLLPAILGLAACNPASEPLMSLRELRWQAKPGRHQAPPTDGVNTAQAWIALPPNPTPADLPPAADGWLSLRAEFGPAVRRRLGDCRLLTMQTGMISDIVEVFLDDRKIGGVGQLRPYRSGSYNRLLVDLPGDACSAKTINVLLYSAGARGLYFFDSEGRLGSPAALYAWYYRGEIVNMVLLAVYIAVGIYHLLIFIRRRSDRYNLYFGLLSLTLSLYWFFRTPSRDLLFADHVLWRMRIEYIALFAIGPLLFQFLGNLFYNRHSRFGLIFAVYCAALSIFTLFGGFEMGARTLNLWQLSALAMMPGFVGYVILAIIRGIRLGWYLLGGMALLMAAGVHDVLAARGLLDTPHIARYTFSLFVLGVAAMLADRFMRVHNQVEELNQNLERRVEERTRQLQASLNEIQALKIQQDGDYFLTSLLITPLGGKDVHSSTVQIDMLVRQKKRFRFRRWDAEIGGDLVTAHSIQLGGRAYTAFLNGDAMGKSIQGAGGALVLGTVFKSVIARTQHDGRTAAPELWLRDCFVELQNIFVSFDGSMLVSAVLGLVDDQTGMMYYINAEHPWLTLYRKHRASFLPAGGLLRKIGISGLDAGLHVEAFALAPDDMVIIGSDGRDDIQIGIDARGHRIINENEQQFLECVEEARGELDLIQGAIEKRGEFTDDFTLLRICYRMDESVEAAQERLRRREESARALEAARASGDLNRELAAWRGWLQNHPETPAELYQAASCALAAGDAQSAREFAERARLRDRRMLENLVLLAQACLRLGELDRARKAAENALALSPGHYGALQALAQANQKAPGP